MLFQSREPHRMIGIPQTAIIYASLNHTLEGIYLCWILLKIIIA